VYLFTHIFHQNKVHISIKSVRCEPVSLFRGTAHRLMAALLIITQSQWPDLALDCCDVIVAAAHKPVRMPLVRAMGIAMALARDVVSVSRRSRRHASRVSAQKVSCTSLALAYQFRCTMTSSGFGSSTLHNMQKYYELKCVATRRYLQSKSILC